MSEQTDQFLAQTESYILTWHGIPAPNESARRLAAELAATVRNFEAQRHVLRFEDEPSGFEAALEEMAEPEAAAGAAATGERA